jgi:hypothetical protein
MLVPRHGGLYGIATVAAAGSITLFSVTSCELMSLDGLTGGDASDRTLSNSTSDPGAFDGGADADASAPIEASPGDAGHAEADGPVPTSVDDAGSTPPAEAAITPSDAGPPETSIVDVAVDEGASVCTPTSCGARRACVAGQCVTARRVFVSSSTYSGNLGGTAGADATCGQLATAASLGGQWMAWVSDDASSPSSRFDQATYAYRRLDGTVVAADWTSLTSGTLAAGVELDENGQPVAGGTSEVWTATNTDGTLSADGCNSFTSGSSSAPTVVVGVSGNTDGTWTDVYLQFCDRSDHVYCFEQ